MPTWKMDRIPVATQHGPCATESLYQARHPDRVSLPTFETSTMSKAAWCRKFIA